VLQLERLDVADYGTLLIPASISQVTVDELHLGREARITIVPGNTALQLQVRHAQLDHGSQITSRGAPGTHEKPAKAGRDLTLRINSLVADELSVDARGGAGAKGYAGLDGANGVDPGCTWGSAGVRWCGSSCRRTTRRSRSRSGWKVVQVAWRVPQANRARGGSPRVAWCIRPMVARRAARGWKGSRGRWGLRGR
jgi:hypothetical protein